jgi:hypothetical protein
VAKYLNPEIGPTAHPEVRCNAEGYATSLTPASISGSTKTFVPYHSLGQCWYASIGIKYICQLILRINIMKLRNIIFALLAFVALCFVGCSDDETPTLLDEVQVSSSYISLPMDRCTTLSP